MKLILSIILSVSLVFIYGKQVANASCGFCGVGQKKAEAREVAKTAKLEKDTFQEFVYQCAKCGYETDKKGKCPMCKENLKKVEVTRTYHCSMCGHTQKIPGDCPKCKMPLKKSTVTYECEMCKTSSNKPGNCPHCNTPLKRKIK